MLKLFDGPLGRNSLVATLPDADRALIEPHLEPIELPAHTPVDLPGVPIERVVFPTTGVGSIMALGRAGRRIEAGLFGCEGMSGLPLVMGSDRSPAETVIQVEGRGHAIEAGVLAELLDRSMSMRRHFLLFAQVMLTQTSQTALSNGHAKLEERLARWLLMCHDRMDGDALHLTHDYLSIMLGVRRAGVTVGTHLLEGKGLIRASRGLIVVLDRDGLEDEAQGSYGVAEAEYARLFPDA